MSQSNFLPNTI